MTDGNVLTAGEGPSRWQVWLEASRPFSFTASVTPVLIGTVLAIMDGPFFFGRFLLALIGSLFLQIGTNMINDYYDYVNGSYAGDSGSSQVIQRGLLTADEMYWAGLSRLRLAVYAG